MLKLKKSGTKVALTKKQKYHRSLVLTLLSFFQRANENKKNKRKCIKQYTNKWWAIEAALNQGGYMKIWIKSILLISIKKNGTSIKRSKISSTRASYVVCINKLCKDLNRIASKKDWNYMKSKSKNKKKKSLKI